MHQGPTFPRQIARLSRDELVKLGLVLVVTISSCQHVAHGWSSSVATTTTRDAVGATAARGGLSLLGVSSPAQHNSVTRLGATLVAESGSSSISPDDDDEQDESAMPHLEITPASSLSEHRNGAANVQQQHNNSRGGARKNNPAMGDTGFLRKRTADLLAHAASSDIDPSTTSLSSRGMKVELKTFHFLFDAWAFSGEEDAADQAMLLLECMEDLGAAVPSLRPDVRSYTKVINAISRSPSLNAGDDAEWILEKMQNMFHNGSLEVKPNTHTYTAVMEAHSNSCVPGSAERAEELLNTMVDNFLAGDNDVKPTARAFNAVLHAYGKAGEAEKAEAVFERMESLYESGIEEAKPRTFNYNALISAWANCEDEGSAQRAEEVLGRMEFLQKAGNDSGVKPTTVSFNSVIDAYAKRGEERAAEKAEEVLNHMGDLYESGENVDAKPNARSFNSVINAWAKSRSEDGAMKAEGLLDLMSRMYDEGNKEVRPDVHSFCTVINAWARSQQPGKADRAYNLFREMRKLYEAGNDHVRPNVVAINAVMNACAYTNGDVPEQSRAMEIAHKCLKEMTNSPYGIAPDQVTYGTFLKACANQMPESNTQQQIVEVLFKRCCRDGQVGNFVLQQLKAMLNEDVYEELVGRSIHEHVRMEDLPKDWWCNVVEGKWRRKRSLT